MNIEEIKQILGEEYKEFGNIIINALISQNVSYVDSVNVDDNGKITISFKSKLGETPAKNTISISKNEKGEIIVDNNSMYLDSKNNVNVEFYERVFDKNFIEQAIKSYEDKIPIDSQYANLDILSFNPYDPNLEKTKGFYRLPSIYNNATFESITRQPGNPTIAHHYKAENLCHDKPANIRSGIIGCWDAEHPTMMRINYSGSLEYFEMFNPDKGDMEPVDSNNTPEDLRRIYEERKKGCMDELARTHPELVGLFDTDSQKVY